MIVLPRIIPVLIFVGLTVSSCTQKKVEILSVPAGNKQTEIVIGGTTVLPSGRLVKSAGELIRITDDPFGMALSPDVKKVVILHDSRIFDAEKAMKKYNRTINWREIEQGPPLDNEDVERKVHFNK